LQYFDAYPPPRGPNTLWSVKRFCRRCGQDPNHDVQNSSWPGVDEAYCLMRFDRKTAAAYLRVFHEARCIHNRNSIWSLEADSLIANTFAYKRMRLTCSSIRMNPDWLSFRSPALNVFPTKWRSENDLEPFTSLTIASHILV